MDYIRLIEALVPLAWPCVALIALLRWERERVWGPGGLPLWVAKLETEVNRLGEAQRTIEASTVTIEQATTFVTQAMQIAGLIITLEKYKDWQ